jgi:phosphoserine phosphatase
LSTEDRESWVEKADAYAREGFRVLAVAWAEGDTEEHLSLLGLVLFWDPPRPEVPNAVAKAQAAGIRVIMITGHHPATALAVAHLIGIPGVRVLTGEDLDKYQGAALSEALGDVNVFARVRPEQELQLVELLRAPGQIVAMTGDGINDAPALKRSDVGVAMGQRGSDVSREVADLVLLDDNFVTIVGAVEEGRGIYENIQKFLRFLFSTDLSEVLLIAAGAVLAFGLDLRDATGALMLPLTAVQILWINLMTDGVPALALAFDRTPGVMRQPPRPGQFAIARPSVCPIRRRRGQHEGRTRAQRARRPAPVRVFARPHASGRIPFHGGWSAVSGLPFQAHVDTPAVQPVSAYFRYRRRRHPTRRGVAAIYHRSAGGRRHPRGTLGVVFGGALLAWGLAEGHSRFVWRQRPGEGAPR